MSRHSAETSQSFHHPLSPLFRDMTEPWCAEEDASHSSIGSAITRLSLALADCKSSGPTRAERTREVSDRAWVRSEEGVNEGRYAVDKSCRRAKWVSTDCREDSRTRGWS